MLLLSLHLHRPVRMTADACLASVPCTLIAADARRHPVRAFGLVGPTGPGRAVARPDSLGRFVTSSSERAAVQRCYPSLPLASLSPLIAHRWSRSSSSPCRQRRSGPTWSGHRRRRRRRRPACRARARPTGSASTRARSSRPSTAAGTPGSFSPQRRRSRSWSGVRGWSSCSLSGRIELNEG
jgi:hypothetical protein